MKITAIAFGCLCVAVSALAADLVVVPGQSIQAAIDAASNGDRVLVQPGTYLEAIEFKGKAIEVIGVGGAKATTIDATGIGKSVVRFAGKETPATRLAGFTIRGGLAARGGGIDCADGAPTIRECVIRDNVATVAGGGVSIRSIVFTPTGAFGASMAGCRIVANHSDVSGGGMEMTSAAHDVRDCSFEDNDASVDGGGVLWNTSGKPLDGCLFAGNRAGHQGGGLFIGVRGPQFRRCVFRANSAAEGGGIAVRYGSLGGVLSTIFLFDSIVVIDNVATIRGGGFHAELGSGFLFSKLQLDRATFANNAAPSSGAFSFAPIDRASIPVRLIGCIAWSNGPAPVASAPEITVESSDVEGGYAGAGNLAIDPKFVDLAASDVHLRIGSPCRDGGVAGLIAEDFEGDPPLGPPDIGADEFHRHAYLAGSVAPGSNATFKVIGQPGDPVLLFTSPALAATPLPIPGLGPFRLALPLWPGFPIPLPSPASGGVVELPIVIGSGVAPGTFAFQCLIGGELSNAGVFEL